MTPARLAQAIRGLTTRELLELNRLLRDLPGWGSAGVREPRVPRKPLDAEGIPIAAERGKAVIP